MIKKSDLRHITYAQFGTILDTLTQKIVDSNITFDLVVPILRSGGFTGLHIASKLKIQNILPVQYKYVYQPLVSVVKKFDTPTLHFAVPVKANILIVDTNTVEGKIAQLVITDIKAMYPDAAIYFASAIIDVACNLPNVQTVFFGMQSNEARTLSDSEAAARKITSDVTIFPWENASEQWQEINALQNRSKT